MEQKNYQLTRHPIGSLREMWHVSYPLILSFLSGSFMMVCDRMFLAHYSLNALNAAANAGNAMWLFQTIPMLLAGITEVFVGRHHGAGRFKRMGEPVWQMLWLCLILVPYFFVSASFAGTLMFYNTGNEALEIEFFSYMLYFGPFSCAFPALCGFFVGKGSVRLVTLCTIFNCFLNIALDPIFIFGWGIIPGMGVKGAAIATGLSNVFGVAVLMTVFLREKHRLRYGTNQWRFRFPIFKECLRLGLPAGVGVWNETLAHFIFFRLAIAVGGHAMTICALSQSVFISGMFMLQGLSKGVTAIISNLIGGQQSQLISRVLMSAVRLLLVFFAVMVTMTVIAPEILFNSVISADEKWLLQDPAFITTLRATLLYTCLFFFFDGINQIFAGMLTATGDTKFLMWVAVVCNWLLNVLPVYFVLHVMNLTIDSAWLALAICAACMSVAYLIRYRSYHYKPTQQVEA